MGKIGYGYGSEWSMLRMLGRHQDWLSDKVLEKTGGTSIKWNDFEFSHSPNLKPFRTGDSETKGLDFLAENHPARLSWQEWWPQTGNVPNWDAVGTLENAGKKEWLLIEAKSHIGELKSSTQARPKSEGGGLDQIKDCFRKTQIALGLEEESDWTSPYYQYANRLASLHFLTQQTVSARVLFVYFLRDIVPGKECPTSETEWRPAINQLKKNLGLTGANPLESRVHEVFIPVDGIDS